MATSKLQIAVGDMLDKTFPQFRVRENYRPEWLRSSNLTKLELDFYIEEIQIAFEIQGAQHYAFTPFFHKNFDDFELRKQYDIEKKDLCQGQGVKLIEIFTLMDAIVAVKDLESKYNIIELGPEVVSRPLESNREQAARDKREFEKSGVCAYIKAGVNNSRKFKEDVDPKVDEMRKFYHKLNSFGERGGIAKKREFVFEFKYLNSTEQQALMEELQTMGVINKCYSTAPEHELAWMPNFEI